MKTIGDLPKELEEFIGKHIVIKANKVHNICHEAKGHWEGVEYKIDVPLYFTHTKEPTVFSGVLRGTIVEEFIRGYRGYILIDPDDKELLRDAATKINLNPTEIRVPVNHSLIEITEIEIEVSEIEKKTIGINYISI